MIDDGADVNITSTGDAIRVERTRQETDKKCPQCGAVLDFEPSSGGLICNYCGYRGEIIVDQEQAVQELDFDHAEHRASIDWGADKKQIICKSCGAESIYDQLDIANECPFCGSNQVMQEADVKSIAPNAVAPFELDAKQAEQRFTQWIKRQWFTPSKAKRSAKADRFKGLYLPFWTFDSDTESAYRARYGIDRVVTDNRGNKRTETSWYSTSGSYSYFVDDQTVIATTRHNADNLRKIQPYDFAKLKPYRPEYLAGFISERYSIGIDDAWVRAKELIGNTLEGQITHEIRQRHRADRVSGLNFTTTYRNRTYKYALLPLWMSSFAYKNKAFEFLVNGQTGKVAGKIPISIVRVLIAIVIGLALLMGLLYLVNDGFPLFS